MSSLSQFFGGLKIDTQGSLRVFNSSTTHAVPANVTYASYGVMGAGGSHFCLGGGGGGGFSYREGPASGPFTLCAIIGAGGGADDPAPDPNPTGCTLLPGGTTTLCSIPTGDICATGGGSAGQTDPSCTFGATGGAGFCGCINTCGGSPCLAGYVPFPINPNSTTPYAGGGGAGGLYGNGGRGGINLPSVGFLYGGEGGGGGAPATHGKFSCFPPTFAGIYHGGGGMGSGGGGGGANFGNNPQAYYVGSPGGSGLVGRGGTGGHFKLTTPGIPENIVHQIEVTSGEPGYIVQFNELGCFSLAKTYFAAAGGGGAGSKADQDVAAGGSPGGAGGGGGGFGGAGGFGGGAGSCGCAGIGGGGGAQGTSPSSRSGGQGVAAFEYWTS